MTNVVFENTADTNLKDISQANITDATAVGAAFTGIIGSTFAYVDQDAVLAISNGECTLVTAAAPATYVAIKGTNGQLGLYQNPQIAP